MLNKVCCKRPSLVKRINFYNNGTSHRYISNGINYEAYSSTLGSSGTNFKYTLPGTYY
jgi:hypothetical protein